MSSKSDKIFLEIGGKKIEHFISYQVESDLFVADDAFSIELAAPETSIDAGDQCKLYVNDELELNGIVDKTVRSYDKKSRKFSIQGRDLMGLLVDASIEEFITLENTDLKTLTERLLKNVPFINRKEIIYGKGNKGRVVPLKSKDESFDLIQTEPGETIFEVLKKYAMSRGLLFFALPNGTLVYGEPLSKGSPEFKLNAKRSGMGNNILEGQITRDISQGCSKVVVLGQKQGGEAWEEVDDLNVSAEIGNPNFPFYKPHVITLESDGQDPKQAAKLIMEQKNFASFTLQYKTNGHSQSGKNYQVNALCTVEDEIENIFGDFLIYGRTFERSKQGVFTTLNLSVPGVLPS